MTERSCRPEVGLSNFKENGLEICFPFGIISPCSNVSPASHHTSSRLICSCVNVFPYFLCTVAVPLSEHPTFSFYTFNALNRLWRHQQLQTSLCEITLWVKILNFTCTILQLFTAFSWLTESLHLAGSCHSVCRCTSSSSVSIAHSGWWRLWKGALLSRRRVCMGAAQQLQSSETDEQSSSSDRSISVRLAELHAICWRKLLIQINILAAMHIFLLLFYSSLICARSLVKCFAELLVPLEFTQIMSFSVICWDYFRKPNQNSGILCSEMKKIHGNKTAICP